MSKKNHNLQEIQWITSCDWVNAINSIVIDAFNIWPLTYVNAQCVSARRKMKYEHFFIIIKKNQSCYEIVQFIRIMWMPCHRHMLRFIKCKREILVLKSGRAMTSWPFKMAFCGHDWQFLNLSIGVSIIDLSQPNHLPY